MRKKLLSEAQVRRFQSLASIKPLNEMDSSYKMHDDRLPFVEVNANAVRAIQEDHQ